MGLDGKVFLTITEAAEVIGCTRTQVRNWVRERKFGDKQFFSGGWWYIHRNAVLKIANQGGRHATRE